MHKRDLGAILLILGTSVGAGMLALPVVTAPIHIASSLFMLLVSWLAMTFGSLAVLEVHLALSPEKHFTSMAQATLGTAGQVITWFVYLCLLYSLLCAYLASTSDLVQALLHLLSIDISRSAASILALGLLSVVVYQGIASIDQVNRGLMTIKFIAYILLVAYLMPHIHMTYWLQGHHTWHWSVLMVMGTSFGYAIIVPSLRPYLQSDPQRLKRVILIGSLLPLFIYTLWILVIQGIILRPQLEAMQASAHTSSLLMQTIEQQTHHFAISKFSQLFISICALTSFLGVSICLIDFLADGLQWEKRGRKGIWLYALSYLPPLSLVLLKPGIFIAALAYAGLLCTVLLIILPLMMLYSARYYKKMITLTIIPGGKWPIVVCLLLVLAGVVLHPFI